MRSGKRSIIEPLSPIIIPEIRSYWATHFYSILKCIDQHKNLQFSPIKLTEYPDWSMAILRGSLPVNFFSIIQNHINNWGVQYFFTSFFNQKLGGHIIVELLERLEDSYGVCFSKNLDEFSFFVSGNDSTLSYKLRERFSTTFPEFTKQYDPTSLISYSDLCLVVESSIAEEKVAIFGEVEGLHGNQLNLNSYWNKKNDLCVFGIGVVDGDGCGVFFKELEHKGVHKVVLQFERSHYVVKDFTTVLNYYNHLFLNGPHAYFQQVNEEFDYFLNYLRNNWGTPIDLVFSYLEKYIDGGDLVGYNDGGIAIITDLHA